MEKTLEEMVVNLSNIYPYPSTDNFMYTQLTNTNLFSQNINVTLQIYKDYWHELINIGEYTCNRDLFRTARTKSGHRLKIINRYDEYKNGQKTTKFSQQGQLFGEIKLYNYTEYLRIVTMDCNIVLVKVSAQDHRIFEALITTVTSKLLYVCLSVSCITAIQNLINSTFAGLVQFVANRRNFCYSHWAVDRLQNHHMKFVSPNNIDSGITMKEAYEHISKRLNKEDAHSLDKELWHNLNKGSYRKQTVAIYGIMERGKNVPNLLVGPFGTGKTFAIAHAVRLLLTADEKPAHKILLCTQSNSAADVYVKDYFHVFYNTSNLPNKSNLKPIRIYNKDYDLNKVHETVRSYYLKDEECFLEPEYYLIITTIEKCVCLMKLNLKFTHIIIDEATHMTECDALLAINLAMEDTHLTLAGDLNRSLLDIQSTMTEHQGLGTSLLHRLSDLYGKDSLCDGDVQTYLNHSYSDNVMLNENHCTNQEIIKFFRSHFKADGIIAGHSHSIIGQMKFYPINGNETVRKLLNEDCTETRSLL